MTTIRDARKAAGLSQQGVTDALGIPKRTLQDWEAGKRTPPDDGFVGYKSKSPFQGIAGNRKG